mmetsp:Transcript_73828/g.202826  ORF Transcript_73828/g.202826 Transcript_73828/m.202826 type:complete len:156 (-) Transcript_73828:337-804(-)
MAWSCAFLRHAATQSSCAATSHVPRGEHGQHAPRNNGALSRPVSHGGPGGRMGFTIVSPLRLSPQRPRSRHVEHGVVMDDVIDWLSCSSIHMRTVARHPQTIPKTTTLHPGPRRTGRRQLLENLLADAPIEREHLMHEAESVLQRSVEPVLFAFS